MVFQTRDVKIPVIYSDLYYVDIGEHVFPTSKYRILKKRLTEDDKIKDRIDIIQPEAATAELVRNVHTEDYVDKLISGCLNEDEIMTLEVPYSEKLVEASLMCCGGTLTAARCALESGAAVHLGGGFHHAFPDHGEGFCVLNDVAVAVRTLQKEGKTDKALVVDCDLHQGNGTAYTFRDDPTVFTFSIHQENNYPFHKPESDIDIGLRDYTRDSEYIGHLCENIPKIISSFKPDLMVFLAGADPYEDDQLGNLAVSKEGLRERDNFICSQARSYGVPLAITLAGGYAVNREDTVDIHYGTVEECVKVFME